MLENPDLDFFPLNAAGETVLAGYRDGMVQIESSDVLFHLQKVTSVMWVKIFPFSVISFACFRIQWTNSAGMLKFLLVYI